MFLESVSARMFKLLYMCQISVINWLIKISLQCEKLSFFFLSKQSFKNGGNDERTVSIDVANILL